MSNHSARIGTILITGICASGKSSLGKRLEENLKKSGINNVKLLEGEDVRRQLAERGEYYGYSAEERMVLAPKVAKMALEYNRKGFICILCGIYHIRAAREKVRKIIGNIMEVYLDCPVTICAQRDYKGHYAKAFQGLLPNFVGVTEPYQKSDHPELVLHTGTSSLEECSRLLFESVMTFLKDEHGELEERINYFEDAAELDK